MKKKQSANAVQRTTISITPSVYAKAEQIMEARDFEKFSTMLQQLIREEWERRNLGKASGEPNPGSQIEEPPPLRAVKRRRLSDRVRN